LKTTCQSAILSFIFDTLKAKSDRAAKPTLFLIHRKLREQKKIESLQKIENLRQLSTPKQSSSLHTWKCVNRAQYPYLHAGKR